MNLNFKSRRGKTRTKLLFTSLGVILSTTPFLHSESVHVMNKKIKSNQKKLKNIETQIESLESEKAKLRKSEVELKKTLSKLNSRIKKSNSTINRLKKKIGKTEKTISGLQSEIKILSTKSSDLKESILNDLQVYHTVISYPQRLSAKLIDQYALTSQISKKFQSMNHADTRKDEAEKKESSLKQQKETLVVFRSKLGNELKSQKSAQARKKELYETTQGRRLIAEMEVNRLKESGLALAKLLKKLRIQKQKDLASRRESEYLRKSFRRKRGNYSWPADGVVVSRFGRQKHPELDITVINNGVKIKTKPNNAVQSVDKGTVIYASDFRSYGQTVIVDHGGDSYTVYGLLGNILVKEGERVNTGDKLGESSADQDSMIYFEVRNQGKSENPLNWLK